MDLGNSRGFRDAGWAVMAGMLALGLAACDQSPPPAKPAGQATSGAVSLPPPVIQQAEPKAEPVQKAAGLLKPNENEVLASRVKAALAEDSVLKMLAIDVGSSGGVITLYGTVDTRAQREKVERVVKKVDGVVSVKNQLVIVRGS